jgi:hypothetical protein
METVITAGPSHMTMVITIFTATSVWSRPPPPLFGAGSENISPPVFAKPVVTIVVVKILSVVVNIIPLLESPCFPRVNFVP